MYRQMFPIYNNHLWIFGDMLSDNTSFRFNPNDRGGLETEKIDEFVANAAEGNVTNMYRESFDGVNRSNYFLQNINNITYASDSVKQLRIGEAKFFRAFHYFNLVRLYGDVPIYKTLLVDPDPNPSLNYPRKPVQQVYDEVILPDVLDAIAKLPIVVPATQKGRLTKAAAYILHAKALMALGRFNDALTGPLVNANYPGLSLNPVYANNFNPATKNGLESILEIQTLPIAATAGGFSFGFMPVWTPWGTGTTIWPFGSNSRGGLNQPTADLNNAYEANDNRKAVTIGSTGMGASTILFMRKFLYADLATQLNPVQWPVYRYADVLLMQAECANEVGFTSSATSPAFVALNAVRTRAGLPAKTPGNAIPALAVNNQADFRLAIERERRVEFAGEGHRWFDLVRTNRAVAVMTAHGLQEVALKPTTVNAGAYTNIKTLIGIPFREVQQFGYPQNPGW
jgi:starch-binding outer membrane protein, SusD/RagB family